LLFSKFITRFSKCACINNRVLAIKACCEKGNDNLQIMVISKKNYIFVIYILIHTV
jgi:hypothetical protein